MLSVPFRPSLVEVIRLTHHLNVVCSQLIDLIYIIYETRVSMLPLFKGAVRQGFHDIAQRPLANLPIVVWATLNVRAISRDASPALSLASAWRRCSGLGACPRPSLTPRATARARLVCAQTRASSRRTCV
jgi:hypothetical protein